MAKPGKKAARKTSPKRRNVQSRVSKQVDADTTNRHEKGKDYLNENEIDSLLKAARKGRYGARDHLLLLMIYRHGLRVSEAIGLRKDDIDLKVARIYVRRLKNSLSVEHPIAGDELRSIKSHLAGSDNKLPWVFVSERGTPLSRRTVNYIVARAGEDAGLGHVHPHMLRHSTGYYLANSGQDLRLMQDYLGHRDPKHTVKYTRVAGRRFEGLWKK